MEKINYSLARKFSQWLLKEKASSELKNDKITYSVQLILNDVEKFLLFGIFFTLIGKLIPYLICAFFLGLLRIFCGGIHLNTFWSCFFATFICFIAIIFLGQYILITRWQSYLLYFIDFILVLLFAPLPSKKCLNYSKSQRNLTKIYSCIILGLVICISMFTVSISNYITWIIVVQIAEIAGTLINLKREGSETK